VRSGVVVAGRNGVMETEGNSLLEEDKSSWDEDVGVVVLASEAD